MTFSDQAVADLVNRNFVAAWHNRGPGFNNEDYSTERWIFQSAMEAYTTKNICTFFLAPDGKVFHYVAGYYSPDVFFTYLDVALRVRQAAFDEKMQLRPGGEEAARKVHETAVTAVERTSKQVQEVLGSSGWQQEIKRRVGREPRPSGANGDAWKKLMADYKTYSYRDVKHEHTARCAWNLLEGYKYLGRLHGWWKDAKSFPNLEDVRYTYLWGNPFTEESPDAHQIQGGGPMLPRGKCGCE